MPVTSTLAGERQLAALDRPAVVARHQGAENTMSLDADTVACGAIIGGRTMRSGDGFAGAGRDRSTAGVALSCGREHSTTAAPATATVKSSS